MVERNNGVSQETSFANGGHICPSNATPWASPSFKYRFPLIFLKSLLPNFVVEYFSIDSYFHITFGTFFSKDFWKFGKHFYQQCNQQKYDYNVTSLISLANYSLSVFHSVVKQESSYHFRSISLNPGTFVIFILFLKMF